MTMLEIHKEALEGTSSVFHEFIGRYNKTKQCVYGFVEGKEDSSFYRGLIEHILPSNWNVELWAAGNKDKVIQLFSDFDWNRFPQNRIAFFVDRDLSEFTGEKLNNECNIYVTDKYSIENDIVNRTTFNRVITEVCNLGSLSHDDKDVLMGLFDEQINIFMESLIPIMAWIIYWKRTKKKTCLDDICMKHLFSFSEGNVIPLTNPKGKSSWTEYIHSQCNLDFDSVADISEIEIEFTRDNKHLLFCRGKYLLWFLVEFSLSVHRDIAKIVSSVKESPKMHISMGQSNGIVLIAPRARIPESLKLFTRNTFCKYIEEVSNAA